MEAIMLNRPFVPAVLAMIACVAALAVAGAQPSAETSVSQGAKSHEDFPFTIAFEEGAIQFDGGDKISITEVRGTSKDMQSGICRISGTYQFTSQESATLAASVTARRSADGRGPWNSAQTMSVTKGRGAFTLMLPISVKGWPHVSFYSNSKAIGGIYIGTGDGVLRKHCE
jgi:hypothetical protein